MCPGMQPARKRHVLIIASGPGPARIMTDMGGPVGLLGLEAVNYFLEMVCDCKGWD